MAEKVGIKLINSKSLGEKLEIAKNFGESHDEDCLNIFRTIGVYLGYTITYYAEFPEYSKIILFTPNEEMHRVGQSIAAASLAFKQDCKLYVE